MKKEKADLEQLLNSLIEKGWKPYGIPRVKNAVALNHYISFSKRTILGIEFFEYTLRGLVNKESGLWQFVCENGMVKSENGVWVNGVDGMYKEILINQYDYRYRLIESSLKDESELEEFLLQNIKIEGKND